MWLQLFVSIECTNTIVPTCGNRCSSYCLYYIPHISLSNTQNRVSYSLMWGIYSVYPQHVFRIPTQAPCGTIGSQLKQYQFHRPSVGSTNRTPSNRSKRKKI